MSFINKKFYKLIRVPNQSSLGFAIMEVMVAVALVALLSYGVMELLSVQQRGTLAARIVSSRDQIASKLARTVGDPRALQATAAHAANTAFNECVIEGPVAVDCDQNVTPLTLLDASGRVVAGPGGAAPVPVIYDEMGAICPGLTSPSGTCPFVVTATFNANCGGPVTCTLARMVRVEYTVQTSFPNQRAGSTLRTVSGDATSGVPLWATNPVGVVNFIPKWGSTTELVTSVIYEVPLTNRIGIGTTTPIGALSVVSGDITAGNMTQAGLFSTAYNMQPGSVVSGFSAAGGYAIGMGMTGVNPNPLLSNSIGVGIANNGSQKAAFWYSPPNNAAVIGANLGSDFHLGIEASPGVGVLALTVKNVTGRVGIGTTAPVSPLSVSGDVSIGDSAMANLFRGIYSTKSGTAVIGFDNPGGAVDDLAVGMGQNTDFETGMAVSSRTIPMSSFYYSKFNDSTNIKAYRGRKIALVVENSGGSMAREAITILNNDGGPNGGFVGINTTTPTSRLEVNGDLRVNGAITSTSSVTMTSVTVTGNVTVNGNITATGTITASSDARLKKNLTPIENPLEKILNLEGLYYNWKDKKRGEERQMGLVAQKTEAVFPEAVRTDAKGMKSINYNSLVAPLIEALREEVQKTKTLEDKIKQLEKRLEKLESK